MKLKKFASGFKNPETPLWCKPEPVPAEKNEVVVAGTVLAVTDSYCRIDINGAKYEIDARDVIDVEEIPTQTKPAGEEGAPEEKAPRAVMIKLGQNAILSQLVPVNAAVLSALGTWMWVSMPAPQEKAAEAGA